MRSRDLYIIVTRAYGKHQLNLSALSIIMAERRFRGPFFRLLETAYAAFAMLLLKRTPSITIGMAQVHMSYWLELYPRNRVGLLLATMSPIANYKACLFYIEKHRTTSERELLTRYNGKPSRLYVEEYRLRLREFNKYHRFYS